MNNSAESPRTLVVERVFPHSPGKLVARAHGRPAPRPVDDEQRL